MNSANFLSKESPKRQELSSSSESLSNAQLLHGTGLVRVDAIEYPYIVTSGTTIEETKPVRLASFFIEYDKDFEAITEAVREALLQQTSINLNQLEISGIRLTGRGPTVNEKVWARIGDRLDRLEVDLEVPRAEKARRHRQWDWIWRLLLGLPALVLLGFAALVIGALTGHV